MALISIAMIALATLCGWLLLPRQHASHEPGNTWSK